MKWELPFNMIYLSLSMIIVQSCSTGPQPGRESNNLYHLSVLDPGHFHAALVQKSMYDNIDSMVSVYAPVGREVDSYLSMINSYNTREGNPTHWIEDTSIGPDYLQKMLAKKSDGSDIVIIAGNNKKKSEYISKSVKNGMNVLADKPMIIDPDDFELLHNAFGLAEKNGTLLFDIMTSRYEITNIIIRMLMRSQEVFGTMEKGSPENPSVTFENLHHFYKNVSGKALIRPAWFFDITQQGNGIADVTTHLIDLIQWLCFPDSVLNYRQDIRIASARIWPTKLSPQQFASITGYDHFPSFLNQSIEGNDLYVNSNGEIRYAIRGLNAKVKAEWMYEAPTGAGDTYYAEIRGTKASLITRQGKEQGYKPILYIKPNTQSDNVQDDELMAAFEKINQVYKGVSLTKEANGWKVNIPDVYQIDGEQQFAKVVMQYLQYLKKQKMPDWEISYMLTKYYTIAQALKKSNE